jgi:hypothetical protein
MCGMRWWARVQQMRAIVRGLPTVGEPRIYHDRPFLLPGEMATTNAISSCVPLRMGHGRGR